MDQLNWPLHILTKAVHFKNLSAASEHVGVSQPQLSRIISKLEGELDVILLDRTIKRKASWTPVAFKLANIYSKSVVSLQDAIESTIKEDIPKVIYIATLEGLRQTALRFAHSLLENHVHRVHLDVLDQSDLERQFDNGEYELIFTFKAPGKQKRDHEILMGYQHIKNITDDSKCDVVSPFEFSKNKLEKRKSKRKCLVSNSLSVREQWLQEYGGNGRLPDALFPEPLSKESVPIYLFGKETLPPKLWETVQNTIFL